MSENIECLISAEEIVERVGELADAINRDYAGKTITLLCALKGAVIFLADLSRRISLHTEIDFITASSYGDGAKSSGTVRLDYTPALPLSGRHVIFVEDIIDSGHTVNHICGYLAEQGAASFKICALLDKPERREVSGIKADYLGFTIPDKFVVGYGLDYAQKYRNLPYVGVLNEV